MSVTPEKPHPKEFIALVGDLVARGRAAGIIVVDATQRPSADIIPTSLRDLFVRQTHDASKFKLHYSDWHTAHHLEETAHFLPVSSLHAATLKQVIQCPSTIPGASRRLGAKGVDNPS